MATPVDYVKFEAVGNSGRIYGPKYILATSYISSYVKYSDSLHFYFWESLGRQPGDTHRETHVGQFGSTAKKASSFVGVTGFNERIYTEGRSVNYLGCTGSATAVTGYTYLHRIVYDDGTVFTSGSSTIVDGVVVSGGRVVFIFTDNDSYVYTLPSGSPYVYGRRVDIPADVAADVDVVVTRTPKFTVKFNANGGTGTMANQLFVYGVEQDLTRNAFFAPSLYAFDGWNTEADGSGDAYEDEADGSELTDIPGGTVTLYAQWRFVGFNLTATKTTGAGTLTLKKDGAIVATESSGTLTYTGAADGAEYSLVCTMSDGYTFPPMSLDPQSGESLAVVFPMSFHEIRLAVSMDGTLAVTSPAEPDYDDSGTAKYAAGRNVVVTATPNAGRKLQKFIIENLATHESSERTQFENDRITLSNISADYLVTAVYEMIDYSLSATVDSSSVGALTVEVSAGSAHYGDTVTFTATPASGYLFEGWYLDGEKIVGAGAVYPTTVDSDLALVAKAKVAVVLDIDAETGTSASLTVNGAAYVPQTPVDVTLGDSLSFALSIATGYFDAWYSVVGGSRVLTPYDSSETITPTASTSLVAVVAADVPQRSATFDIKNDEGGASVSAAAGDVTLLPAPDSSSVVDGKLVFVYTGTKKVRVTCAASIEGRGLSEPIAFTKATLNGVDYSENREFDLVVNGAIELTLWYGSTGSRTVTIGYTDGSDMTMGEILADGGTDPVTKPRGQKVAIFAAPKNGYTFIGWFSSPTAQGDPLFDGEPSFEVVVSTNVALYARFAQNDHSICEWEGSKTPKALVWRSKTYAASKPFNPSACRVDALGYPPSKLVELTVDMFSAPDVNAKPTASTTLTNIANQNARRLPVRRMERYMQVQIKANVEIDALLVGTSMEGLAI